MTRTDDRVIDNFLVWRVTMQWWHSHILLSSHCHTVIHSRSILTTQETGQTLIRKLWLDWGFGVRCEIVFSLYLYICDSLETWWLSPCYVPVCWPCQHTARTFSPIWRLSLNYQTALTAFRNENSHWVNTHIFDLRLSLVFSGTFVSPWWQIALSLTKTNDCWLLALVTHGRVVFWPLPLRCCLCRSCQLTPIKSQWRTDRLNDWQTGPCTRLDLSWQKYPIYPYGRPG